MTRQTPTAPGAGADLVLFNGKIVTVDPRFTIAEAVAVTGNLIIATGRSDEMRKLAGPKARQIDLQGRTVLPGLHDSHAHVEDAGLLRYTISFDAVTTIAEAQQRIRELAQRTPPGEWLRGRIWHPLTQLAEKRFPTRAELDAASREHPIYLPIGHFTLANSAAIELAGITRHSVDPEGGRIWRDADGEPSGVFEEAAEKLISSVVPDWSAAVREQQLREAMTYFNRYGITSAVSGAVRPSDAAALRKINERGEATLRISLMLSPTGELNPSMTLPEWQRYFEQLGPPKDGNDPWLSHAAVKLQIDGGMTLRTALTRAPYPGDPQYHGVRVVSQERLDALVAIANRHGWRVGVHAVGDAGIDAVLDAFERAHREHSIIDRRFILVHASLMQPDQMERARRLGVRADIQNVFLWQKAEMVRRHLGDATAERAIPTRTLLDVLGIDNVAAGTDFPINPLNPFINIYMMVTRKDAWGRVHGAAEAITREEAIRLYTSAAARYTFSERHKGTIEPGKLADLVVLSHDILTVPEDQIRHIEALLTIVDGRIVHDALPAPTMQSQTMTSGIS